MERDLSPKSARGPTEIDDRRGSAPEAQAGSLGGRSSSVEIPGISKPVGGGAIRSIDESLSVGAATGMASLSVPVPLPVGRSATDPSFELNYSSGTGMSPFGLGWAMDGPQIARRTNKGTPQYADALNDTGSDSDTFTLSGDDLVPVLVNGFPARNNRDWHGQTYRVREYRPRTEGSFLRAEHWTDEATGQSHWRVIDSDNLTSLYGLSGASRIQDPERTNRIAVWLADLVFDDKGNVTQYIWIGEDNRQVGTTQSHEVHRTNVQRTAQRYLKTVRWANRAPWAPDWSVDGQMPAIPEFRFSMTIDYGDHGGDAPSNVPDQDWPARHDPYSTRRYGFEVRTYRRAQRILVHHHFPEEEGFGDSYIVRSLRLEYVDEALPPNQERPAFSLLVAVHALGHRKENGAVVTRALPPLEVSYTPVETGDSVQELDRHRLGGLPSGLAGGFRQWVDFDGDGVEGVLELNATDARYTRNLTPISDRDDLAPPEGVWFAPTRDIAQTAALAGGRYQVFDLNDDGQPELVRFDVSGAGYHQFEGESLGEYRSFEHLPASHMDGITARMADFTGDGRVDLGAAVAGRIRINRGEGATGFAEEISVLVSHDVNGSAADDVANTDVRAVDMSGDGLVDLVHIEKRGIWYRPNLGRGQYGVPVFMDGNPFDDIENFDASRVFLSDLDGTGTADIVYVDDGEVLCAYNRGGDQWTAPRRLPGRLIPFHRRDVRIVDLFGRGTKCLVWSSTETGMPRERLHFIELIRQKPHLLNRVRNNRGVETRLYWSQSTRFAAEDRRAGRPWLTRLPFPVHVVERQESIDRISRVRSVKRFAYHGGHYDSVEKEFRGFSLVETWDTETEQHAVNELTADDSNINWVPESTIPPVLMRTWYHTGVFADRDSVSTHMIDQYWLEPGARGDPARMTAALLPDTILPDGLDNASARDACRALRGRVLRTEIYDVDRSGNTGVPYSVTEQNFDVRVLQTRGRHGAAVCLVTPRETLSFDYERDADDPRVKASFILETDHWGNPLREIAVSYPRREAHVPVDVGIPMFTPQLAYDQRRMTIVGVERSFTNEINNADELRIPLTAEERSFSVVGVSAPIGAPNHTARFTFAELDAIWAQVIANPVAPESIDANELSATADTGPPRHRITAHSQTFYRHDDLSSLLPLGTIEPLAIPGRTDVLALPENQRQTVFGADVQDQMLLDAGYLQHAGSNDWWVPGEELRFHPDNVPAANELAEARQHFWLGRRSIDPFGNSATATFDIYDLLAVETRDPVGNRFIADIDYRVLQPRTVTDPNGDQVTALFDTLSHVVAVAVQGRANEVLGDNLQGINADLSNADRQAFDADPEGTAAAHLADATTRVISDPWAYFSTRGDPNPRPNWVASINRETHASDVGNGPASRLQLTFTYLAGTGATIQTKSRVEDGVLDGQPGPVARWLCSAWVRINSKGLPYETFEPVFSANHGFAFAAVNGVSAFTFYDPIGRVVGRLFPDQTLERVDFSAWQTVEWDANDLSLLSNPTTDPTLGEHCARLFAARNINYVSWHDRRIGGNHGGDLEERVANATAAQKTAAHAATPNITYLDATGRPVLTIIMLSGTERQASRSVIDASGRMLGSIDNTGRYVVQNIIEQSNVPPGNYVYGQDLLGRPLTAIDLDGGRIRSLPEVDGSILYLWDARGLRTRTQRDANRRVTHRWLSDNSAPETLVERTFWGDNIAGNPHPDANARLNGQVYRTFGQDGLVSNERFDFKANLIRARRSFVRDYRTDPDWSALAGDLTVAQIEVAIAGLMDAQADFQSASQYDALSRPIQVTTPNGSGVDPHTVRTSYNRGGLVESVWVWIDDAAPPSDPNTADHAVLQSVSYNARRQVTTALFGNNVSTTMQYDPETFRVRVKESVRPGPAQQSRVQDLLFVYDGVGNPTQISDRAQDTIYYNNNIIHARSTFVYDALYQLTDATGREHLGLSGTNLRPPVQPNHRLPTAINQPSDGRALGRYTERYAYDDVGNLLSIIHETASGQWRRGYTYDRVSRIEPGFFGNRLGAYREPGDPVNGPFSNTISYDAHGNAATMPHLSALEWDYLNRLRSSSRQVVNNGVPERTYYQYNSGSDRTRKVTDRQAPNPAAATRMSERLYLGGFIEVHRTYDAQDNLTLRRETLHFMAEGQRMGMIERRTAGNDPAPASLVRYQYTDHLGSGVLELDDQADVISHASFHPFGTLAHHAARSDLETPNRYRYTGRERDDETGFSHHGNRYYAAWLGRWISPDPAGFVDGPNRYIYVSNNPVRLIDPNGTNGDDTSKKKPKAKRKPKATAEFGDIKKHGSQGKARWTEDGKTRLSEHEHIRARTNLENMTKDPKTGISPYDEKAYSRSHTLTIPRDMALEKTRMDMELQKKILDGTATADDMSIHADVDRTKQAREITRQKRVAAGLPTDDLDKITDNKIQRAAHYQQGELFEVGKSQKVDGLNQADIDDAFDKWDEGPKDTPEPDKPKAAATAAKPKPKPKPKPGRWAKLKTGLKGLGKKATKVIPFVGIGVGAASAAHAASQGDTTTAALDTVGLVPVLGDVVDAARLGVAVGELASEVLGIDEVATEDGMALEGLAKSLGASDDVAMYVGAATAAISSITTAPARAVGRRISEAWSSIWD